MVESLLLDRLPYKGSEDFFRRQDVMPEAWSSHIWKEAVRIEDSGITD
jgi:hypothetical protein